MGSTYGQQLEQLVNEVGWTINQNGGDDGFDSVTPTQSMTGKNPNTNHPTAHVWYDELIISARPIAAPAGQTPCH